MSSIFNVIKPQNVSNRYLNKHKKGLNHLLIKQWTSIHNIDIIMMCLLTLILLKYWQW